MFDTIKANPILNKTARAIMVGVTRISPSMASKLYYYKEFHRFPDLNNPKSFAEKLMYLKLNDYCHNDRVTMCADKYRVRSFVAERGFEDILNDLYGVWDSTSEINWDLLPERFVIKCNHGCGYNIICTDKDKLCKTDVFKKLDAWMREDFWVKKAEVNYREIPHKIICEAYIDDGSGKLPTDYKFYCFNGIPTAILVVCDRGNDKKGAFMSSDWNYLGTPQKYKPVESIPLRPLSLSRMIAAAEALSKYFPFVRADFYQGSDRAVFGELTFTPGDCLHPAEMDVNGVTMGEMIHLGGCKEYELGE